MRREEDGKCGTENMRKRCGTLDKERQQELPCLLQVNGGGAEHGRKRSGEMVEECEKTLSYLFKVETKKEGGMKYEGESIDDLHEESDEELSALSEIRKPGKEQMELSEEITHRMELDRTLSKECDEVLSGSFFTNHDHNSFEGRY